MSKKARYQKATSYLNQALSVLSETHDSSIVEAKTDIRKALGKIENAAKKKKETPNHFNEWWGHIQSGTASVAQSPMSSQARMRSLSELNKMIEAEQQKLKELENEQNDMPTQLLSD
jgi:hypothetical protein